MKYAVCLSLPLLSCLAISLAPLSAASLAVGDPAPPLKVSQWVQGEPVTAFAGDKVYVVEFWATWCGPCLSSIPHLNQLHQLFKDKGLVVIGQNVWESDPIKVRPFVKKMGRKMSYRVALDLTGEGEDEKGVMARTWMEAAGQSGIPTAFIVDQKGRLAWIDHPMNLNESLLEEVLTGKYDIEKAAADYAKHEKLNAATDPLWRDFNRQKALGDWDKAISSLDRMEEMLPEEQRPYIQRHRFDLLLDREDYDAAFALAKRVNGMPLPDPSILNEIAWSLVTREGMPARPLDLAETIARHAYEASREEDAEITDTLARVYFLQGRKDEAIRLQEKAVQLAAPGREASLQRVLEGYRAGSLPRQDLIRNWQITLNAAIRNRNWAKAETALAELEKLESPAEVKTSYAKERFRILTGRNLYDEAYRLAKETTDSGPEDVALQNQWAWEIATAPWLEKRNLDLAEQIARRGHEAAQGKDAEIADTLGRILFMKGRKEEAIDVQRLAVASASGNRKVHFQEILASYEAGQLPPP